MHAWPRRLFLLVMLSTVSLAACAPQLARARSGPDSFAPVVRRVLPAVVNIGVTETVQPADDPFTNLPPELQKQFRSRRRQQVQGAGSGYIIDPTGFIVTNNHVVGNADKIIVSLNDGTDLPAQVVGVDPLTDVALIKVQAAVTLPYVSFGSSQKIEVGDWVIAAGNPFGLGGSVTAGIVSARGRNIGEGPFDDFIQLDAPINPGNSGGPVFDEDGLVIGMNTAILSPTGGSVGVGFAIPSELVSRVVGELRSRGRVERGWLGVSVQDGDTTDNGPRGVNIQAVDRSGPAARAGLRPGDVVTAVDGQSVENANRLIKAIAATPPGTSVRLTVRRGRREVEVSVAVGRRPPDGQG